MQTEPVEVVHVRMPKSLVKRLDHWAVDTDRFRAGAVEELVRMALDTLNYQHPVQPPAPTPTTEVE